MFLIRGLYKAAITNLGHMRTEKKKNQTSWFSVKSNSKMQFVLKHKLEKKDWQFLFYV